MVNEIKRTIQELQHDIAVAGLNYEIWWVYKDKESRRRFVDTLSVYPLFFQTSLHAHFVAMTVSLYRLYETRKDTINLPQLLRLLGNDDTIPRQNIVKMESEITQLKPLWAKVAVIRNNMFGHRSNTLEYDGVWEKADIAPKQLKELIDETKRILNEITVLYDRSTHAFNLSATQDTVQLLEDLSRLNEEKL